MGARVLPRALVLGAGAVAATLVLTSPVVARAEGDGAELRGVTRDPPIEAAQLSVPDESPRGGGEPFRFAARPRALLLMYFGYTSCPDVCPTTLADIGQALRMLGREKRSVDTAMMTFDPDRDTGEVLSSYLEHFVKRRYHALRTTDAATRQQVLDTFGASAKPVRRPGGSYDFEHTATTYVLDSNGTVLLEWPFGTEPKDMAHDLRILLAAPAEQKGTSS